MSTELPSTEPIVLPAVAMNDELAKAIHGAVTAADVRALILDAAQKQSDTAAQLAADQVAAEKAAADKVAADQAAAEAAVAAQGLTRVVEIGGRSFTFEGASEAELDRLELNAIKVAYAMHESEAAAEVVIDPAEATRAAEAEVAAKADLERKWRAGEITSADYIQQSGALKQYLENEGVSLESLKAVVDSNKDTQFEQSWAQAGETFRNSAAGADWPGGLKNQELIGLKIAALGLADAIDKVAALAQAYAAMKQSGLYFPNGDNDATPAAASVARTVTDAAETARVLAAKAATDAEATRAAAAAKVQSMSSSIFGASSGTSGAPVISPAVVDAKKVVPADATPAEIMQAWKEAQIAQGKDINEAFLTQHRSNAR